ncbi:MAG: low molecular weight protein-tyrosine-phosphatase [Elainellaceae cyanobacterium]
MPYKILFVCLGNICRSPSAEGIMNHLIQEQGLQGKIQCDSAGTSSYHVGSAPDSRMTLAAKQRGIALSGRARQFTAEDFDAFDLIVAMDQANYRDILRMDPNETHSEKVRQMCEFASQHSDPEVPDPYYGGSDGFSHVVDLLLDACQGLLTHIKQTASRPD